MCISLSHSVGRAKGETFRSEGAIDYLICGEGEKENGVFLFLLFVAANDNPIKNQERWKSP